MTWVAMALCAVGSTALAYDIAVMNGDGVTIYYNYINNNRELEVSSGTYSGAVAIPERVVYMDVTRKVTSIGTSAFSRCKDLKSVTIPNSVTSIGNFAFEYCSGLASIVIPNSVTTIGSSAFNGCSGLTSVTIGNAVTTIGGSAFSGCKLLTSVIIPNSVTDIGAFVFRWCSGLTSVTIGNNVTAIGDEAFRECTQLTSVTIPSSVTNIGGGAFMSCRLLTSVTIPNSVTSIGAYAFEDCRSLTYLTIGSGVTSIGDGAFSKDNNIISVVSLIENPFVITGKSSTLYSTFSLTVLNNSTLYVPEGTIDKYYATAGWQEFVTIEEGDGGLPPGSEQCEKPTIGYKEGKLTFQSATEGATFVYDISDADVKSGEGSGVQLGVTYVISVYAKKDGCLNSEMATATLCWIDVEPEQEGITNGDIDAVNAVKARPVLVQRSAGGITVEGAAPSTPIAVYDLSGKLLGSAQAADGITRVAFSGQERLVVVRIGERSVKMSL